MRADHRSESPINSSEPEPDAVARGWSATAGGRGEALFVLAGRTLGISWTDQTSVPVWLDLDNVKNLDAIGDPAPDARGELLQEVEVIMEDGSTVSAGWPLPFCDDVVATLERLAERTPTSRSGPDVLFEEVTEPSVSVSPTSTEPAAADSAPSLAETQSPLTETHSPLIDTHSPLIDAPPPPAELSPRPGTLELEDVVYLGGYPGHGKKRKRCTATLSRSGLEVTGPGDLHFRIAWDVVRTIEVQNSDEARFRMNAKIHRDASALVIECDQGVTVLLEARDCPTLALRAAIAQLMADLPVVVV